MSQTLASQKYQQLPHFFSINKLRLSLSLVAVVPDSVCEALHVESVQVLVRIEPIHVVLHALVVAILVLLLRLVIVVHVVHLLLLQLRVLLFVLFHHLEVDRVVHLESLRLNLLLPVVVVDLHVV